MQLSDSASTYQLLLAFLNMAVAQPVLGVSAHQRVAHAGAVARALPNFGLFVKAITMHSTVDISSVSVARYRAKVASLVLLTEDMLYVHCLSTVRIKPVYLP